MRETFIAAAVALTMVLSPLSGYTQTSSVSAGDIERLQFAVEDARRDVATLGSKDEVLADRLRAELDELGDEVIYLKVRLRKERSVSRNEYVDLRDRIDAVRHRAVGSQPTWGNTSPSSVRTRPNEIPAGQEMDVRLSTRLYSDTAQVEDRVEATTLVDLYQDERLLVPAGSVLRGTVTSVNRASRTDRKGSLTVAFDQLTVNRRNHAIRATVTQALESEGLKGEVGRIATGAGVGAIIGGMLGGFKGVLAGILIGGGGTIIATEGKDVDLPPGTVLRVRFDAPLLIDQSEHEQAGWRFE